MSIIILSRPIHSGKTSELQGWCSKQKNIGGILMPDINGKRKLADIFSKEIYDAEYVAGKEEELVMIGKYEFYASAFEKGNYIIEQVIKKNYDWLVIDEAGKLELDKKGFYSAIQKAIAAHICGSFSGNIILVVRDTLVDAVLHFFDIKEARVINAIHFL